ncbi:hypothetical protein ACFSFX_05060 [Arthrobacter flavus]|uniref:Uncharacterized protein n=2 Tax=Arthrobacter flavus TaxID=95172 RepID=A0ABW4Q3Q6_9MICC
MRPAVGALLQDIAGKRLVLTPFGDAWTFSTRMGKKSVLPGLEEVAAEIVSGPLDWQAVTALTGEAVSGVAPELACPSAPVLERIATSPLPTHDSLSATTPELTPGQFTAALLVRAANAHI